MGLKHMAEPLITTSLISSGLIKFLIYVLPPSAAALVVMLLMKPESTRELACALVSSFFSSMAIGGWMLLKVLRVHDIDSMLSIMSVAGVLFFCALPGWACVRALFLYVDRSRERDIVEIYQQIKKGIDEGKS